MEASEGDIVVQIVITKQGWMRDDWRTALAYELGSVFEDLEMQIQAKREIEEMTDATGD